METFNTTSRLEMAQKKVKRIKGFYTHALVYVLVNLFIIISNSISSPQGFADTDGYMTALFWGFGLFAHFMAVFGQDFILGRNWEERRINEILNK